MRFTSVLRDTNLTTKRSYICRNVTDLKNEACQKGHLVGLEIFWFIIYHGFWVFFGKVNDGDQCDQLCQATRL